MPTIQSVNTGLTSTWEQYTTHCGSYLPMQYALPAQDSVVFVGMNPSFSERGWRSLIDRSTVPHIKAHAFFAWPRGQEFNIDIAHELEHLAKQYYPFFAPHRALANALNRAWEHFDLFALRDANQKNVGRKVFADAKALALNEFALAQFALFVDLLTLARPAAVIVTNALASRIYCKQRKPVFDVEVGFHRDSIAGHSFPIFFSGMLTGGRALDTFSRDRLFWQVSKALGTAWQPIVPGN